MNDIYLNKTLFKSIIDSQPFIFFQCIFSIDFISRYIFVLSYIFLSLWTAVKKIIYWMNRSSRKIMYMNIMSMNSWGLPCIVVDCCI